MDFLWKNLTEKEKEEIKKKVDSNLKSFSKKLSEIKEDIGESDVERKEFEREEDDKPLELSRQIMFDNAPEKNKDFIIAEKKKW
jgi:Asp-tRNA(Asn)/Glu-tRNA(Gln) amidotransferase C subunit